MRIMLALGLLFFSLTAYGGRYYYCYFEKNRRTFNDEVVAISDQQWATRKNGEVVMAREMEFSSSIKDVENRVFRVKK